MKYMLVSIAAVIAAYGAGYALARLMLRRNKGTRGKRKTAVITVLAGTVLMAAAAAVYFSIYYRADGTAQKALQGNDRVRVTKTDGGYFFDGPSDTAAIIFYPGAKVESEAYAGLMLKFADAGFDCFLADMPLHFALLGKNTADRFLQNYSYDTWIMAGHSMGGIAAADFADSHPEEISGILLLPSYPGTRLSSVRKLYSIYGSEDGCLEYGVYEDARAGWPEEAGELIIPGGNHAQFGNYGPQRSDGTAEISADEQQKITAEAVSEYFGNR